ncbi:MAG TPA: selenocysteine-specific translation elongation factor [Solirubrobacteraceae bacterium]|jgi:selenocysteine-specific elongation factor|nr:selenocysteine-specific translation elongation factor [Solirubrobacteraceae bacterium]
MSHPHDDSQARADCGAVGVGSALPLTIGTAGHVDHGKTALVAALTGVDCDRLPEEKARGLTIALGYASLPLPSGRRLSLIDVPGHERFVRTMVAGATGIDLFLMVIAADDGVMPQTLEHARVLRALGVDRGVVAVTKCDLASPLSAQQAAVELLPGCVTVACSARTREGLAQLRRALDELAARTPSRAAAPAPARLHVDRVFTVAGRGTVVTGTLWSGAISRGDVLDVLPAARRVRVRGLQVHDCELPRAVAGQRVAANLTGARAREISRGDLLAAPGAVRETRVLDCALALEGARPGERVQVHHGTRAVAARASFLVDDLWQLRLEQPLLALDGDRVVVRRIAPGDTLGGGVVLDAGARRHGSRPQLIARLQALREGRPVAPQAPAAAGAAGSSERARSEKMPAPAPSARAPDGPSLAALEQRLRHAGAGLLSEAQMEGERAQLKALRAAGSAVRVSGRLYAHAEVVERMRADVVALLQRDGAATLGGVRDALGVSRKSAQAFLEHLDREHVTRRLSDDTRVLARRPQPQGAR